MEPIPSIDDPRLADFRDFREHKRERTILVEGELAVTRLLEAPDFDIQALVTTPGAGLRLQTRASARQCPHFILDANQLRELSGFHFHRGCLALAQKPAAFDTTPTRRRDRVLLGVGLADPANVGAMIRNAKAFGADEVWLDETSACPFSRRAVRSSVGHCFTVPIRVGAAASDAIAHLHHEGLTTIATKLGTDSQPIQTLKIPQRWALIVGNEGFGLSDTLVEQCQVRTMIPMQPGSDSVNVATATGILLYHLSSNTQR